MKKREHLISVYATLLLLFTGSFHTYSQEPVLEIPVEKTLLFRNKQEAISLAKQTNDEFVVFLRKKKKLMGISSDTSFNILKRADFDFYIKGYPTYLNYLESGDSIYLLFSNRKKSKFLLKSVDFQDNNTYDKILNLQLTDERLLETVTYKNKIYLFTIKKVSSILKVYVIENKNLFESHVFNFSHFKFSNNVFSCLYDEFLSESHQSLQMELKIQKIKTDIPYPLDFVTESNKLYQQNHQVYITIDNNLENTVLISIDLESLKAEVKSYMHGNLNLLESKNVTSNSFLYKKKLFQVIADKKNLNLSIYNLPIDSLICLIPIYMNLTSDYDISSFSSTKGSYYFYSTITENVKEKKSLRKISNGNSGLIVYSKNNDLHLKIGGAKERIMIRDDELIKNTNLFNVPIDYKKTLLGLFGQNNYNPIYIFRKSYYFSTVINEKNYQLADGATDSDIFNKIRKFNLEQKEKAADAYIFKFKDDYLYGYYQHKSNKFILRQFED
jgi:hypothetical protein